MKALAFWRTVVRDESNFLLEFLTLLERERNPVLPH
jgi:hypothetical protein